MVVLLLLWRFILLLWSRQEKKEREKYHIIQNCFRFAWGTEREGEPAFFLVNVMYLNSATAPDASQIKDIPRENTVACPQQNKQIRGCWWLMFLPLAKWYQGKASQCIIRKPPYSPLGWDSESVRIYEEFPSLLEVTRRQAEQERIT